MVVFDHMVLMDVPYKFFQLCLNRRIVKTSALSSPQTNLKRSGCILLI
ncbi:unnamed protein product [Tenebrio molitor]|nr:unnamed protein product [Tenebrio molitor]